MLISTILAYAIKKSIVINSRINLERMIEGRETFNYKESEDKLVFQYLNRPSDTYGVNGLYALYDLDGDGDIETKVFYPTNCGVFIGEEDLSENASRVLLDPGIDGTFEIIYVEDFYKRSILANKFQKSLLDGRLYKIGEKDFETGKWVKVYWNF